MQGSTIYTKINLLTKILVFTSLLLLLNALYLQSYAPSLYTPTLHLDGAFQTASALFRLENGEVLGKDFFFYLGIGPLYFIYPIFKFFGGTLASSILASFFVVKLAFLFSLFLLTKLSFRLGFLQTLLLTLLFFMLLKLTVPQFYIDDYLHPGNSLKPIRRFVPIIGAVILFYTSFINIHKRVYYLGFSAGILALWSNDYGYFAGAFLTIYYIYVYFLKEITFKVLIKKNILFVLVALSTYFIILTFITQGHAIDWITYNFQGVGKNQWWYYVDYTSKIFYPHEILDKIIWRNNNLLLNFTIVSSLLLIPILFLQAIKKHIFSLAILAYIGVVLISGSFVSEYLGSINTSYWVGIYLWLVFACFGLLYHIQPFKYKYVNLYAVFSFFFSLAFYVIELKNNYIQKSNMNKSEYITKFDSYLNPEFDEYIKFIKKEIVNKNATISEEYSSLASALLDKKGLVPFDSVIHALGKENKKLYIQSLEKNKPEYIITTNPKFSHWQAWSFTQNWWFYSYLFKKYQIEKEFHNQLIWKKNMEPYKNVLVDDKDIICKIQNDEIVLESNNSKEYPQLLSVGVNYELSDTKIIILIKNNISTQHAYTSIDTSKFINNVNFPLVLKKNKTVIPIKVFPEVKKSILNITKCNIKTVESLDTLLVMPLIPEILTGPYAYILTDENWVRGVARKFTGFFVSNIPKNVKKYKVGTKVKFINNEIRVIENVIVSESYINIFVDGKPLDGMKVGYPHKIEIIKE